MTGPAIPNEELVALATDTELEGTESTPIVQAVADKFGAISAELANAIKFAASDATREQMKTSLTNAKALSDQNQAVLNALLAPVPEPEA